jgi:hypothetical protein
MLHVTWGDTGITSVSANKTVELYCVHYFRDCSVSHFSAEIMYMKNHYPAQVLQDSIPVSAAVSMLVLKKLYYIGLHKPEVATTNYCR